MTPPLADITVLCVR